MMQKNNKTITLRSLVNSTSTSITTSTTTTTTLTKTSLLNNISIKNDIKIIHEKEQLQKLQQHEKYDINLKQTLNNYMNQIANSKYEYDFFLAQLKQKQNDSVFICNVLNNLKECIHFLEPSIFENLIYSLFFDIKWYLHVNLLNNYSEFLIDLISAYTQYIYKCLQHLIKLFLITKNTDLSIINEANCNSLYDFSHNLILNLIKIAPTCKTHIIKLVDTIAPYMIKDTCIQEAYIKNLLRLAKNLPQLRLQILEICVQKMLKIDVNAPRDQIINAEQEQEQEQEQHNIDNENKDNNNINNKSMKHPFADRLDAMMLCLFDFIRDNCHKNDEFDWNECKLIYKDLLFTFDKYILTTYGSSHVQFLLFYICSYRTNLSEGYLDYLWKKFSNPNTCPITRQLCTYYIGSFLSRANYIPLNTIIASMQLMCTWIHSYMDKIDASKSYPNIDLHRTFYALCQTVFYIFIFRHRDLITTNTTSSIDIVKSWKFSAIISSKLNPLRFCLPTITKKFASLARLYQLAYCYSIIDNNNRLTLPSLSDGCASNNNYNNNNNNLLLNNAHNNSLRKFFNTTSIDSSFSNTTSTVDNSHTVNLIHQDNPLDSFFPFDPYLLSRSKLFIENLYQNYIGTNDDENEEEYDNDDDDDDDDEMVTDNDDDDDVDDDDDDEENNDDNDDIADSNDEDDHKDNNNNKKCYHNPWSEDDEI